MEDDADDEFVTVDVLMSRSLLADVDAHATQRGETPDAVVSEALDRLASDDDE